ncbi:GGDEF domain-containing protein [uncultured Aquitalea sp.]|uniref:GGDEF domain-containing protein n=1 Tax=uncultured Aquitalea sp. TaxID=540272 RepID=UPI0025FE0AE3|nr:GGDEF domain-containing protein [uncultured Aquitalea sp.]
MHTIMEVQPFSMAGALLLAVLMASHRPLPMVAAWWGSLTSAQLLFRVITRFVERGQPTNVRFSLFACAATLVNIMWGSAVWWLVGDNDLLYLLVVLMWLTAVSSSFAAYFAGVRLLMFSCILGLWTVVTVRLLLIPSLLIQGALLTIGMFILALAYMSRPLHAYIRAGFSIREENARLIGDLTEQKQRLDVYNRQLEEQNLELDTALASIEDMVSHDPLTGVLSRRALMQHGEALVSQASGRPLALAMLDLDHFKRINDNGGHLVGDEVLTQFCRLVSAQLRQGDLFGRYGGEEFLWLAEGLELDEAARRMEDLCRCVAGHDWSNWVEGGPVTVSIGVVVACPGGDWPALVRRADELLYQAKRNGRNQVAYGSLRAGAGEAA